MLIFGAIFSGDAPESTFGPDGIPNNKRGDPYPSVLDPRTGHPVPFPRGDIRIVPKERRTKYDGGMDRYRFIKEWLQRGFPAPPQGWDGRVTHIHHIRPLSRGGDNDFSNLVPLSPADHKPFTDYWNNY